MSPIVDVNGDTWCCKNYGIVGELFEALDQGKFADSVGNGCRPQGGTPGSACEFSSCSTLRWVSPIPLLHT